MTRSGSLFAGLLQAAAIKPDIPLRFNSSTKSVVIKQLANTYQALLMDYFNELDSYAPSHDLDTRQINEGICLDQRIGALYNNSSFGYSDCCMPKDTKQLLANYKDVTQTLISTIVSANSMRKEFMANDMLYCASKMVGIYRLVMKAGSDNFRASNVEREIKNLMVKRLEAIVYKPSPSNPNFFNHKQLPIQDPAIN